MLHKVVSSEKTLATESFFESLVSPYVSEDGVVLEVAPGGSVAEKKVSAEMRERWVVTARPLDQLVGVVDSRKPQVVFVQNASSQQKYADLPQTLKAVSGALCDRGTFIVADDRHPAWKPALEHVMSTHPGSLIFPYMHSGDERPTFFVVNELDFKIKCFGALSENDQGLLGRFSRPVLPSRRIAGLAEALQGANTRQGREHLFAISRVLKTKCAEKKLHVKIFDADTIATRDSGAKEEELYFVVVGQKSAEAQ